MKDENILIISVVFILLAFLMAIGFFFEYGDGQKMSNVSEILAINDTPQDYIPLVEYLHPNATAVIVPENENNQVEIIVQDEIEVPKSDTFQAKNDSFPIKSDPVEKLSQNVIIKPAQKSDREIFQSLGQNRVGIFKKTK